MIYFIVSVERGQRRITVNYAQRQGRVAYQNQSTHLPLKVNMSGVIPAIFASSIVIFPSTLATWFSSSEGLSWLTDVSAALTPGNLAYTIMFSGLIIFFCFFYTAMVFNSKETADNLKRSGAFIPGIRPGRQTADYIDNVLTRLTMVGSLYLVAVCLLPDIFRVLWAVPFYFRWHLGADRGCGHHGFHRTDPGASDFASVRQPDEEGEPEILWSFRSGPAVINNAAWAATWAAMTGLAPIAWEKEYESAGFS